MGITRILLLVLPLLRLFIEPLVRPLTMLGGFLPSKPPWGPPETLGSSPLDVSFSGWRNVCGRVHALPAMAGLVN